MAKGVKSAFAWSAVDHFCRQAGQLFIGIVLARHLSPTEFGLIGMLVVFLSIGSAFASAGLGSALIQKRQLSHDDTKSCFYLNLSVAIALAGVLCLISPLVAAFYQQPVLKPMLCVLSLQLVFSSFMTVPDALRSRDLDFKTLAIIHWTATLLSGLCAIGMAWSGYGVWSLVAQAVLGSFLSATVLWLLRPWRPQGTFRWACISSLWPFSSRLLAASLLNAVFGSLYHVVIGKIYNAAELGLFTQARRINDASSHALEAVVSRVAFPVFSQLQDDPALLKTRLRQLLRLTATVHFPLMLGLVAAAPALVAALLTERWLECVPLLQVLSIAGLLHPLHAYHLRILQALGRSDLFFRLELIKRVLAVSILAATAPFGVFTMTCGILVNSFVCYWLNSYYTRSLIAYGWGEQTLDLAPMLVLGVLVAACGYCASMGALASPWINIALQTLVMGGVTVVVVLGCAHRWFPDSARLAARLLGKQLGSVFGR